MKILMTATVPSMIGQFNMNNMEILLELGYEVEVACNFKSYAPWSENKINLFKYELRKKRIIMHQIDFDRDSKKIGNHLKAYKQMKNLMNERKYSLIHTHTPVSSLVTRIAFKNSQIFNKCKLIYTAHGFHFFKGNSLLKNFLFRSLEKLAAKYTDVLITINNEDYESAKKFRLKNKGSIQYIPGIGINLEEINSVKGNRDKLIKELNISRDSVLLLSVGELNNNKNHKMVIESLPQLSENIHYIICGEGNLECEYFKLARNLNVDNRLHLLGYRNNVIEIMKSSDIFVFPSKREGLPVALMEALACGLPSVATDIRGNRDLIRASYKKKGYLIENRNQLIEKIEYIIVNLDSINKLTTLFMMDFSTNNVQKEMKKIYSLCL